jgi:hypothetical protein
MTSDKTFHIYSISFSSRQLTEYNRTFKSFFVNS